MKFGSVVALNLAVISMIITSPIALAQQEARQPDPEQEISYPDDVKVNIVPIYGNDPCPESSADEIVVCPEYAEGDRYRVPKLLRNNPNDPENQSWNARATGLRTLGASGTNSCSPSGAGGFTGCIQSLIDSAYAERREAPGVEYGRIVDEERRKRLELIDGEAEDVERRIVEFEKARAEKEAAEAAAAEANSLDPKLEIIAEPGLPELEEDAEH